MTANQLGVAVLGGVAGPMGRRRPCRSDGVLSG